MIVSELLGICFPHLAGVHIDRLFRAGATVRIEARTGSSQARCPACGIVSRQVHSRYERRLCDQALAGQEVVIHLRVARYFCRDAGCAKATFAEQVPGLTRRHGRDSTALREALTAIALALGGRAGARLAARLAVAVGRMTLLRIIRALPDPVLSAGPRILGVDDFALRRGHRYGTLLIDIGTGRPIDMLAERSADALATWLTGHPGVHIICRDRAGCYAEGAARGAPQAIQVADRWHMWRNLGEAVERAMAKHRAVLRTLPTESASPPDAPTQDEPASEAVPAPEPQLRSGRMAERTRQRHAAVHDLLAQGRDLRAIATHLGLGRNTVRRFARADSPEELLVNDGTGRRPRLLDAFEPYLRQRWNAGYTNAEQLYQELRAQGYQGRPTTLRQYLRPWRATAIRPPAPARPPSVRQAAGWLLRDPATLHQDERRHLNHLTTACPPLAALREHVSAFAHMMLHRHGERLEQWMAAARADDLPDLHSFIAGLHRDLDAARAGLTLPYSSGPVEGHVNRVKMIKRQMYGRANPDLLRKRVLLAD
ncbi:ISL3 family transposase [Nonomuraea sp. NPDC049714]|uniref:ISL3 family transposase n=1 Tax=Nonomuraea sp. NPDC049714 TaxID=3364357 RepID=UPI0037A6FAE0